MLACLANLLAICSSSSISLANYFVGLQVTLENASLECCSLLAPAMSRPFSLCAPITVEQAWNMAEPRSAFPFPLHNVAYILRYTCLFKGNITM